MPIVVKDFKWKQSECIIIICVPIKGITVSKADIFTGSSYIKVSFAKYFFELFLLHKIEPKMSKCTVVNDEIIFELQKSTVGIWENIEVNLTKYEKQELKKTILSEEFQLLRKEVEENENKKHELKRVAVREQISLDTKQRELIEDIKNKEKQNELGNLEEWRKEAITEELSSPFSTNEDELKESEKECTKNGENGKQCKQAPKKISRPRTNESVPLPRKQSTLAISFTKREFPTPCRESKLEEENEWLKKQVEVRRTVGFVSEDLRPEERNPLYLKSKGDQFMKAKNYLAAISAYSFGIKLSEKFADLYIRRSEAHFLLEHYQKSARDCSYALDLLKPPVFSNLYQRVECICRRGESLCKLGMYKEGIEEMKAALDLQSDNDEIRMKIEKVIIDFKKSTNVKENNEKNGNDLEQNKKRNNCYENSNEMLEDIFIEKEKS